MNTTQQTTNTMDAALDRIGGRLHVAEAAYARLFGVARQGPAGDGATGEAAIICHIAEQALRVMAEAFRIYGASAGLPLLCGLICARMMHAPGAAATLAARTADAVRETCEAIIEDTTGGAQ